MAPSQRPGPRLGRDHPADLRERPGPGGVRGPAEELGVLLRVRQVGGGAVHRHHPQPAAEHPRTAADRRPGRRPGRRPASNSMCSGSAPNRAAGPRQDGDVRRPPPPALPRHPPSRPGQAPRPATAGRGGGDTARPTSLTMTRPYGRGACGLDDVDPVGRNRCAHTPGRAPHGFSELPALRWREVGVLNHMPVGYNQGVPASGWDEREERRDVLVLVDDPGTRVFTLDDGAERAPGLSHGRITP